jgi:hypothetical protein
VAVAVPGPGRAILSGRSPPRPIREIADRFWTAVHDTKDIHDRDPTEHPIHMDNETIGRVDGPHDPDKDPIHDEAAQRP